jgi:hypothetical protein
MRRRNLTVPRQTARTRRRRLSARLKRTTRPNAREGEATPRREPPSSSPSSSARPLFVENLPGVPTQHELARLLCDLSKIDERVVGDFVPGFFRELSPSHRQNALLNTAGATDGDLSRPLTSSGAAAYSRERDGGVSCRGAGSCVALACQDGSRGHGTY